MAERRPRGTQAEETVVVEKEKKDFDPRTLGAFEALTGKTHYSGMSYDEKMAIDENLDGMRTVERRRGHAKSQNTLYLADLLVGSKYSDNEFFNEVVEGVAGLPAEMKPDEIVISGLYIWVILVAETKIVSGCSTVPSAHLRISSWPAKKSLTSSPISAYL